MKKILLWGTVTVVVLLVVAVVAIGLSLDGAVKRGVETIGPQMTKTAVKLENVKLSVMSGSGEIKGLTVANPEGYQAPHAISLGSASLTLNPRSLFSKKVVVRSFTLKAPEITFEAGLNGINLSKLLANVNEATAGSEPSPEAEEEKEGKRMQVDDLLITGAKLNVRVAGIAQTSVPLEDIHLTALGTNPEGITAGELSKEVLAAIEEQAVRVGKRVVNDISKGSFDLNTLGGTNSNTGKLLKDLTDPFKKKQ